MAIIDTELSLGDLERAATLIEGFIMGGDLSEEYQRALAHAIAEYDMAPLISAIISLAAGARSYLEAGRMEVVASIWEIVGEMAHIHTNPMSHDPGHVLAEIERSVDDGGR